MRTEDDAYRQRALAASVATDSCQDCETSRTDGALLCGCLTGTEVSTLRGLDDHRFSLSVLRQRGLVDENGVANASGRAVLAIFDGKPNVCAFHPSCDAPVVRALRCAEHLAADVSELHSRILAHNQGIADCLARLAELRG